MSFIRTKAVILLAALIGAGTAHADLNLGLGVRAGTLGLGLEASWNPIPWLDVRAGGNRYDYDDTGSQAGVNYDATLRLDTYYATANFKFPLSPFRLSLGAFSNNNEVLMVSQNTGSFDIGGVTYTAADVGTLQSTTSFDSTSPYLGAGFDFEVFNKIGLSLDFGVLWQGDPKVSLTSDGLLAQALDPAFLADLEAERQELEDEVDALKAYPVVGIGFHYKF